MNLLRHHPPLPRSVQPHLRPTPRHEASLAQGEDVLDINGLVRVASCRSRQVTSGGGAVDPKQASR